MSLRATAIEVCHWHSLHDAAYLQTLAEVTDVELIGLHDPSPEVVARRAKARFMASFGPAADLAATRRS